MNYPLKSFNFCPLKTGSPILTLPYPASACYHTKMWRFANACFEAVGATLAVVNVFALVSAKTVSGVYWPTTAFSAIWAVVAIPYYLDRQDRWSAAGAGIRAAANAAWVAIALY